MSNETIVSSQVMPKRFSKFKLAIAIALYFVAIFAMLYFIFFVHLPLQSKKNVQNISYNIPPTTIKIKPFLPNIPSEGIVKQVYADELPVQMEKVFSYPAKNIPIAPTIRPKKEVVGFIPYWTMDQFDKLNVNEITTANLFGIEPDGDGNIIITNPQGEADPGWAMWNDPRLTSYIDTLKKKQIKVDITIKMFSNFHIISLTSSPEAQQKLISNIMYMVESKNLDGVNLDFEYVGKTPENVREGFSNFVSSLDSELKKEFPTATLTIDTYASSAIDNDFFDLPTLSHVSDAFIIMGYDFHTPYTDPGPVAPLTGEKSIVSYLANYVARVSPDKIILAVPYYGYDWITNSPSPDSTSILPYADILADNSQNNIQWDNDSETPWYQYSDSQGNNHKVFFENVRSLGLKYDLVNERGLKGIGIWAIGYEGLDNQFDQLISQKFGY